MAFRRIIFSGEKSEEAKKDLERLFNLPKHKIDFPNLKIDIKQGSKPNTFVIDLNGEGADSVSKKVKDIGIKFGVSTTVKNEIPMKKSDIINEVVKKLKEGPGPISEYTYEEFIDLLKKEIESWKPKSIGGRKSIKVDEWTAASFEDWVVSFTNDIKHNH